MKVKELIELLQKEDPEMRVVLDGYESGFDELHEISHTQIGKYIGDDKDKNWYDGEFTGVWKDPNAEVAVYFAIGGKQKS